MGDSACPWNSSADMTDYLPPVSAATAGVFAPNPRAIRLLLANDGQKFLDGFRPELESEFAVVATARSGEEALRRALDHKPDVVLFGQWQSENEMPSLRRLKALPRPPKVLVLADRDCAELSSAILAAGADVCLPKSRFPSQWRALIRRLALPT